MTPDYARELLENATPGPWEYEEYTVSTNDGRDVLTIPDGVYGVIGEQDGPLVAAAPDLAALVADMRYEYAVQVPVEGHSKTLWKYVVRVDNHGVIMTQYGHMARWEDTWQDAAQYAVNHNLGGHRIVRRLVSDEEVVE